MSKIKNGWLDQYGKVYGLNGIGSERVNIIFSTVVHYLTLEVSKVLLIITKHKIGSVIDCFCYKRCVTQFILLDRYVIIVYLFIILIVCCVHKGHDRIGGRESVYTY